MIEFKEDSPYEPISDIVDVDAFVNSPVWRDLKALLTLRVEQAQDELLTNKKYASLITAQETIRFAEEVLAFPEEVVELIETRNTIRQQEEERNG